VRRIISPAGTGQHAEYLKKLGFIPMPATEADAMMFTRSVA
jgi:hypothetical protein